MFKVFYRCSIIFSLLAIVSAGGISVDSGLTPPQKRVIFRTQARFMNRTMINSGNEMKMHGKPLVLAYGLTPRVALMGRIIHMTRLATPMTPRMSGWSDILVLGKFKLWRKNTAAQTIGVAGVIAGEFPTGSKGFSSDTYGGIAGLQGSLRRGSLSFELNLETKQTGVFTEDNEKKSGEWSLNSALARIVPLGSSGSIAVTPVLEFTRTISWETGRNGRQVWVSPGLKLTVSSFIIEGLLQFPVAQSTTAGNFESEPGGLIGIRLMF